MRCEYPGCVNRARWAVTCLGRQRLACHINHHLTEQLSPDHDSLVSPVKNQQKSTYVYDKATGRMVLKETKKSHSPVDKQEILDNI